MRKAIILTSACVALIGTGALAQMGGRVFPRDQKIMDQWLAGKQPGEARNCIPQSGPPGWACRHRMASLRRCL